VGLPLGSISTKPDVSKILRHGEKESRKQARWIVSESLQKQVAQRSKAFGRLIAFEQCDVLKTRILSGEDMILQGPFLAVAGVPLKSVVIRHQANWMMAVAPSQPGGKMPDPNLLEVTDEDWILLYRERNGKTRIVATGRY
jgi:hypothetical protein